MMKKRFNIIEALLLVTFVTSVILLASCGNSQKPKDTRDVAVERNEAKFENKLIDDAKFLVDASENNLKQIQLGQLAQQKGSTAQVKELGKMMEDTHTKSQRDLTALANRKTITIPTSPTNDVRDAYNDLNKKSGVDFNKAYTDLMVNSHKDAIATFEKASTDSYDIDVKKWATASLSDLRAHLVQSVDYQDRIRNN
jgi:putative membrane protein